MTHHMTHTFTPSNQTNPQIIHFTQQFTKYNIQSHSSCNQKRAHWIAEKYNHIPCRPCVHCGTFPKDVIDIFHSSKHREILIFAHIFILKQNTNQATDFLDFHLSIFFLVKGLGSSNQLQSILTLIVQTIVSAELGSFSKQQQGALTVSL